MLLKKLQNRFHFAYLVTCLLVGLCQAAGCGFKEEKDQTAQPGVSLEHQTLGMASDKLLEAKDYDELLIEVAAVPGHSPSADDLNFLQHFLERILNKPRGIHVVQDAPIPTLGKMRVSAQDAASLETSYRKYYSSGRLLTVFYLFVDGFNASDQIQTDPQLTNAKPSSATLAFAYQSTSIVAFPDAMRLMSVETTVSSVDPRLTYSVLERFAVAHEFGHLLGLVGIPGGAPMVRDHMDRENGLDGAPVSEHHCDNKHCLMYYRIGDDTVLRENGVAEVPDLDQNCLDDLRAAGGRS